MVDCFPRASTSISGDGLEMIGDTASHISHEEMIDLMVRATELYLNSEDLD